MDFFRTLRRLALLASSALVGFSAFPASASEAEKDSVQSDAQVKTSDQERAAAPADIDFDDSVFDETWVTVGIGAGLVPSYSGSDDYRFFPLPLVVGRVGGVGITPNGPGFTLNFLSQGPQAGPAGAGNGPEFSLGPSFRLRNDRADTIKDDVVKAAGELDTAFELGASAGVTFPGVLHSLDRVSVSTQVRWDVAGAHDGMLIEPSVSYFTPVGRNAAVQLAFNASFVDDSYADYYYSVSAQQSTDTGLAQFSADGGLDSVGTLAIITLDLDGNALNGGFSLYGIGGYSRLVGDGADTPYTSVRGSADQFIGGLGLAYTF